jgi:hypothetical protein
MPAGVPQDVSRYEVIDRVTAAQPTAAPEGATYLVAASATGDKWGGHDGDVAELFRGSWRFFTPRGGDVIYDTSTSETVVYDRGAGDWWSFAPQRGGEVFTGEYDGTSKVYAKWVSLGTLPNATTANTAHGASIDFAKPVHIDVAAFKASEAFNLNFHDGTNYIYAKVDATNIVVTSNYNYSSFSARARIRYCKP